ncbi:bifunctional tRNA (5-methylaminomethyl-2-thiouridine)(34)-methyltransferase MnmD/FAD-dependent 5-carboxymethylaminomethyl-2-thiouridine(34) oxidoreductase MnmC [Vibrio genomosp. F6]|uniref:bifunctional tRNA (5-methylaminomethyl-2-thiouridine)(34)-methyltransferase MnmD/FAD-dependent 5-carboxymethylaminomethyl-2-thiouridine(34) oxidoreductase MnmC n=1 Tax=Vibrio genomosp. F6 TaxID=723172 RepID=UPI0010BD1624|nr:bifunctional tRNA (5-methylaminomethyl-2-thiouridine)(34)-methyltransferase MnmD/FAD-dependent 5-carboxymethylaminomethyl-2-thiouridine(34) oxidoreductase MnmC [Vibrio genomosp. F6]TKF22608.1 bifunctional tRNA (5-methylaminomethyl-2-thiouridine)(34)-methyltransferase MnmD/FAD-dependent 5-carboxymethylaminomethyl-2-thiouridine(34) oxidoreductase MnmC [Vibrio genomosp. F6]
MVSFPRNSYNQLLQTVPYHKNKGNMTSITNAELGWNEAGTPVSDQFDDVYFSNVNGLEETRYVFLQQNHLPQRWQEHQQRRFTIGETGFGTGLNFLAVWQWFDKFLKENPDAELKELHFVSFEKFPLNKDDLIKAHQAWPELAQYAEQLQQHYPIAVPECHRIVLADGAITLDLWFGDIKDCMPLVPTYSEGIIDAWFLDGFAPSKNPEMWNQDLFDGMAKLAKQDCTCATFTAAGFVRRGLIDAGFEMKKVKGFGIKREMIAGTLKNKVPYTNTKPWYGLSPHSDSDDIAIIGGGIASAALAKTLSRRGKNITVYCEHEQAAGNASGNNQGAIYPLLSDEKSNVSRVFSPGMLFARQFIEQAAESIPFDHDWCGVNILMWDEASKKKLNRMLEGNFHHDLIQRLSQEEANKKIGLNVDKESVYFPLGGWLSPLQLTQGLFKKLEEASAVTTHYQHQVTDLKWLVDTNQWQLTIETPNGEVITHHDQVVVANGHKFTQFEQTQRIPLTPVKGQVSHIPTTENLSKLKTVLCFDGYLTPQNLNNGHHCIGANYDKSNIDQEFDPEVQQHNGVRLAGSLPDQEWAKETDTSGNLSRQGIRSVSRDHLPFVGNVGDFEAITTQYQNLHNFNPKRDSLDDIKPVSSYPNLYCFIGLGSRGLSSASLLAEVLASQICGDPLPLPADVLEAIHPSRMWVRRLRKGKALTNGYVADKNHQPQ